MDELLAALGFVGDVVDTPGRFARTALSGRNPFASIFDPSQGASGRDMLETWGVLDPNQEGLDAGDVAGFGAEMLFDPLNALGGLGLLKTLRGARAAKSANAASAATDLSELLPSGIPKFVQRIEEVGAPRGVVDKPHGLYTSPAGVDSPHADLGGETTWWQTNPSASVYETQSRNIPLKAPHRGLHYSLPGSAGMSSLADWIGEEAVSDLLARGKSGLMSEFSGQHPGIDWTRYYDAQEMIEALAGIEGRTRGFDAIFSKDKLPEFSEYVGLSPNAFAAEFSQVPNSIRQPVPSIAHLLVALGGYNTAMLPERGP